MSNLLPYFTEGEIVKGFGRGSKDLGIPTANFPSNVVQNLPLDTGIYYGWAKLPNISNEIYKMVVSVGWNPFYDNKEKSMETHIMHNFNKDLYGEILKVCVVGHLRPEKNFNSLEELIEAINNDIKQANEFLDLPANSTLKSSNFFQNESKVV